MSKSCKIIKFKNVSSKGINKFNFRVKSLNSGNFYDLKFDESKMPQVSCTCRNGSLYGVNDKQLCSHKKRVWSLIEDLRGNK